ncbi:MAG: GNAT family N-acetyltransferase [Pseudomonadota bacterium]
MFKQADSYLRLIDGKGCVFVCEQGNKLIGIAALASGVDAAELLNLVVATAMRRNGCALALLRRACAWAQDREQTRMLLEIRAGNSSARLLYKKFGFETDGVRAKYYLDAASGLREDAILMSKELASELGNVDTHT